MIVTCPPRGVNFKRIAGEVIENLLEALAVCADDKAWRNFDGYGHGLFAIDLRDSGNDLLNHRASFELLTIELEPASLQAGIVENILDDSQEMFSGSANVCQESLLPVRQRTAAFLREKIDETDDGVHRGAKLVAHRREETGLLLVGPLSRAILQFELDVGSRQFTAEMFQFCVEPAESFFTEAERFFGFLVRGDIDARADKSQKASVLAVSRSTSIHNPVVFFATVQKTVLDLEWFARFNGRLIHTLAAGCVFGMDAGHPSVPLHLLR